MTEEHKGRCYVAQKMTAPFAVLVYRVFFAMLLSLSCLLRWVCSLKVQKNVQILLLESCAQMLYNSICDVALFAASMKGVPS